MTEAIIVVTSEGNDQDAEPRGLLGVSDFWLLDLRVVLRVDNLQKSIELYALVIFLEV